MPQQSNLIPEDRSTDVAQLLSQLLLAGLSCQEILDRLSTECSSMPVEELFRHVEESSLLQILGILNELMVSDAICDMDVGSVLTEIFENFTDQIKGRQHLFAVLALVQLMQVPTNEVTPKEDKRIEAFKLLFLSTLFDDGVVVQLMGVRDEYEQRPRRCPCHNCNATFIFAIGWYIAAQNAHNANAFVGNAG